MELKWQSRFETGIDRIDFEHRIFLDIIIDIDREVRAGKGSKRISRLLFELQKYGEFHFISEENIMIECGFPGYKGHAQHHADLNETFSNKKMLFDMGEENAEDILAFLIEWFVNHTLHEDMKIAKYIGRNPPS